jgi:hypothetical protein
MWERPAKPVEAGKSSNTEIRKSLVLSQTLPGIWARLRESSNAGMRLSTDLTLVAIVLSKNGVGKCATAIEGMLGDMHRYGGIILSRLYKWRALRHKLFTERPSP